MKKCALFTILLPIFAVNCLRAETHFVWAGGFKLGEACRIKWSASGVTARLRLILFDGERKLGAIANDLDPNAGFSGYRWSEAGRYEGGVAPAGTNYRFRLRSADDSVDVFSEPFCLYTVTSPRQGDRWEAGSTHDITWVGIPGGVSLYLYEGEEGEQRVVVDWPGYPVANTGRFTFRVPEDCFSGKVNQYRVAVMGRYGSSAVECWSDYFTITPPLDRHCLRITRPRGGQEIHLGEGVVIEWEQFTSACGTEVKIQAVRREDDQVIPLASHVPTAKGQDNHFRWNLQPSIFRGEPGHYVIQIQGNGGGRVVTSGEFTLLPER